MIIAQTQGPKLTLLRSFTLYVRFWGKIPVRKFISSIVTKFRFGILLTTNVNRTCGVTEKRQYKIYGIDNLYKCTLLYCYFYLGRKSEKLCIKYENHRNREM